MKRRQFIAGLGAISTWPLTAHAQQAGMPLIGFLSGRASGDSGYLVEAFNRGLAENGFIEGKNVAIEYRWASGAYDQLPKLAAELVGRQVAVLVAVGGDASARAAKAATSVIPIVFGMGGDPVAEGLVASFNHPGGNVTGVSILTNQMETKRLGLLHELLGPVVVGVLINPTFPPAQLALRELEQAAGKTGQRLVVAKASDDGGIDAAFALFDSERVGGLLVAADPFFDTRSARIVALALQRKLPGIYQFREYALAGGLLSYGVNLAEAYHQFGVFAAEILRGAKPADLPVQQSVKFETVINLKTAKAIGFEFPATFSARADEAIE
ncbi:MAG TPA: ABC transporter substrate-binding protein [Bradyrhizobium sp.]|jgi:putative ABC transport system substrate-binding protein|nr:ABC transporter substrate-binding protein [Bradyrhizobium sp.]